MNQVTGSVALPVNLCVAAGSGTTHYKVRRQLLGKTAQTLKSVYSFAVFPTLTDCNGDVNQTLEMIQTPLNVCKSHVSDFFKILPWPA